MNTIVVVFIAYLVVLLGVSFYAGRSKVKDSEDFFLGGRKIGGFATGLSAAASGRSGGTMLGNAGLAFVFGFHALWLSIGFTLVEFFGVKYLAPKLRRYCAKHNCLTVSDYLSSRFDDDGKNRIRTVTAIIIFIFMAVYLASQLLAMRLVFTSIMGWPAAIGILVAALVIALYCFFGGYVAVVWTDVIQALLMIVALVIIPIFALAHTGGLSGLFASLQELDNDLIVLMPEGRYSWILGQVVGVGLMQFGLIHTVVRWMSAKSTDELKLAAPIDLLANTIVCFGGMLVGWCGRAMFQNVENLIEANSEMVFLNVTFELLPGLIAGIAVSAVFAAVMSSADSQLMVASSCLMSDLYQKVLRKGRPLSDKQLVWGGRISVMVIMLLAYIWAMNASDGVYLMTVFAGAVLAGGIGIPLVISMVWKRTTKAGFYAGMILGTLTALVWKYSGLTSILTEAMMAILVSGLAVYIVSLCTKPAPKEEVEQIFTDLNQD